MKPLDRITTKYIESEDRLRLSGETSARSTMVIWLTQRLTLRLVPILLQWLEQHQTVTSARADIVQGWAQQVARQELTAQPPVKTDAACSVWLAQSIDISRNHERVVLTFKGPDEQRAELTLAADPLRQWLNIVYDAHVAAEWPLAVWPEWVSTAALTNQAPSAMLH